MAGHMANVKDWILPDCMMPDGGDPCRGFQQLYAEHARLDAEIERLREALQECAGDLESYVDELYPSRTSYPGEQRRYERDIEPVRKARALLSN
jgi:DNA gyrase/topoisomerase IV subunit A